MTATANHAEFYSRQARARSRAAMRTKDAWDAVHHANAAIAHARAAQRAAKDAAEEEWASDAMHDAARAFEAAANRIKASA